MSHPIIHDGYDHRAMTDQEYADWQQLCADVEKQKEAAAEAAAKEAAAKTSARAKLKALGLTDAEIAALVG